MQVADFLRGLCCAMLGLSIVGCNHVDEITPRSYVGMVVADTLPSRTAVAQALLSGKAVSNAGPLVLKPRGEGALMMPVDFGWITAGGAIIAHNKQYGVIVVQEPFISSGEVKWSCVVYPAEAKPNVCGDK